MRRRRVIGAWIALLSCVNAMQQQRTLMARFYLAWNSTLPLGGPFSNASLLTGTVNAVLQNGQLDTAILVGSATLGTNTTFACPVSLASSLACSPMISTALVSATSCIVVDRGAIRNFVSPNTGLCAVCSVCNGAYQMQPCTSSSDTVCASVCDAGRYVRASAMPDALGVCDACAPGTFSDQPGQRMCAVCPQNSIAPHAGATACTQCPPETTASSHRLLCLAVRGRHPI